MLNIVTDLPAGQIRAGGMRAANEAFGYGPRPYPTALSMAAKSRSMSAGVPVDMRRCSGEWP